jgi:uncharacterized membrane protein
VTNFFKKQASFFIFGLAFWLPLGIVIFILALLFSDLEAYGRKVLVEIVPTRFVYPGYGIIFGILLIYVSGLILKLTRIRVVLSKVPVIGLFFGGGEVITIDRLLHLTPCLFLYSPTCMSYGWILSEERTYFRQDGVAEPLLNVYYPNVPTLVTGQVFPVRKSTVIKLGNSSKEIIDLLLYAFRSPAEIKYLPWEDESPDDFEKRARTYGLDVNGG